MSNNRVEEVDKHQNNHDYKKEKNSTNTVLALIGSVFILISFILFLVSLAYNQNIALWVSVVWFVISLIGTLCCMACEDESDNHKKKYKEQMQNQFQQGTPIITYNDYQHQQQIKQPLIQNQQYIQNPNHLPVIYLPQMYYQNQQNGYFPYQQQNYQQQDPLIYQQQPPYQYNNGFPAQTVKVEKQQHTDQATQTI